MLQSYQQVLKLIIGSEDNEFILIFEHYVPAVCYNFFQKTQMALIERASYKCYGPGRWILKEGHSAQNMYLIVEGQVRVTKQVYNPAIKVMETVELCKLHGRQSFGESAIMFDTQRVTSVQSLSRLYCFRCRTLTLTKRGCWSRRCK